MIPLKFYRDENYVYYNNPNGITKKMSIGDFEALMSGSSGGSGNVLQIVGYMFASIDEATSVTVQQGSSSYVDLDSITYFSDLNFSVELEEAPTFTDCSLVQFTSPPVLQCVSVFPPYTDEVTGEMHSPSLMLYNGGNNQLGVSDNCSAVFLLFNRE